MNVTILLRILRFAGYNAMEAGDGRRALSIFEQEFVIVIEQVFGLPGIGQLMLNAIYHRDYTQVQATVLVVTTLVVLINIVVDLSYYLLDPRIQQHG